MNTAPWYKRKSNITVVIGGLLNAAAGIFDVVIPPGINEGLLFMWMLFMRQGVEKSGNV